MPAPLSGDLRERIAAAIRPCHVNDHRPKWGESKQISYRCDSTLPPRRRFGSEGPQRRPGDEVALKIECVVDGSVHVEEALDRASRLEPLHFTLAASHNSWEFAARLFARSPCS